MAQKVFYVHLKAVHIVHHRTRAKLYIASCVWKTLDFYRKFACRVSTRFYLGTHVFAFPLIPVGNMHKPRLTFKCL